MLRRFLVVMLKMYSKYEIIKGNCKETKDTGVREKYFEAMPTIVYFAVLYFQRTMVEILEEINLFYEEQSLLVVLRLIARLKKT